MLIRAKPKTPEQLFKESGLSREEWNEMMRKKAEEADKQKPGSGYVYTLMMIDSDGKSVATKLADAVARDLIRRMKSGEKDGGGENAGA